MGEERKIELEESHKGFKANRRASALSPNGKIVALGGDDGAIILFDAETGKKLSYLFDAAASAMDAFVYNISDQKSGRVLTFTQPCGASIPLGATCVCNCVPGAYVPPSYSSGGFGGSACTCNKICTCIPVCQAHRLLDSDLVVRMIAEQLLLAMGKREFRYMQWAAERAEPRLKERICQVMNGIASGAGPDVSRWPNIIECVRRLDDPDEVVSIMAAQMLSHRLHASSASDGLGIQARIQDRLNAAIKRPWYIRAGLMPPTVKIEG